MKKLLTAVLMAAFLLPILAMPALASDADQLYFEQFQEQFQAQFEEQFRQQYEEQLAALMQDEFEKELPVTAYEISLLEMVAMNEAGNQGIQGMRYVVACVLNRVDSLLWPNTIEDVVYMPNQFATGNKWKISNDCKEAVRQELYERSDDKIIFFCSTGYNYYGTPAFRYRGHWFSYQ